jgi:hypothetical protein
MRNRNRIKNNFTLLFLRLRIHPQLVLMTFDFLERKMDIFASQPLPAIRLENSDQLVDYMIAIEYLEEDNMEVNSKRSYK